MLSVQRLVDTPKGGAKSIAAYMATSEYYRPDNVDNVIFGNAVWLGDAAEKLGLNKPGRDQNKDFENLLAGYDTKRKALTRNAGKAGRRMGWDLTFSADKSVSLIFAAASDSERVKILDAHHRAVKAATDFILNEQECRTGKQGQGKAIKPVGFIARAVDHIDSRDGDPTLHTHYVLINAALCPDGKYRTLDESSIVEMKHAAGAIYRQQLAQGLEQGGWGIDSVIELDADSRPTGQVWHKIAGVGAAEQKHFSKRRAAIEKAMAVEGLSAQEAALRTRRGKTESGAAEVMASAVKTLSEWNEAGLINWKSADDLIGVNGTRLEKQQTGLPYMLESLHKTNSDWGKYHFVDVVAKHLIDVSDPVAEANKLLSNAIAAGMVLELNPDSKGRARYCSKEQWDLEAEITAAAVARVNDNSHKLSLEIVEKAIKSHEARQGFTLTAEQREAVLWATTNTGGVCALSGKAGTGKTATAGAYIQAFIDAGYTLYGTSTAQLAAQKLQSETGLNSMSCARLLDGIERGSVVLSAKSVIVVDEAGMVGAKTLRNIQISADKVGAKILLLGDALQLQPVEAGAPFRLISDKIGKAELSEIRRQKKDADKKTAQDFYSGKSGKRIVSDWEKSGALKIADEKSSAVSALVADYLSDARADRDKLIIANTHNDRRAITAALRAELIEAGKITAARVIEVDGDKLNEKRDLNIGINDRIKFGKNDKKIDVSNGETGSIKSIVDDGKNVKISVQIESDVESRNGKIVNFNLSDYSRIDHAWASTTHASQGQGKSGVFWLATAGQGLDRNMGLVAFTRTKDDFRAYTTDRNRAALSEKLDAWGTKQSAAEIGLKLSSVVSAIKDRNSYRAELKAKVDQWRITHISQIQDRVGLIITTAKEAVDNANRVLSDLKNPMRVEISKATEILNRANRRYTAALNDMENTGLIGRILNGNRLKENINKTSSKRDEVMEYFGAVVGKSNNIQTKNKTKIYAAESNLKSAESNYNSVKSGGDLAIAQAVKQVADETLEGGYDTIKTVNGFKSGRAKLNEIRIQNKERERQKYRDILINTPSVPAKKYPVLKPSDKGISR